MPLPAGICRPRSTVGMRAGMRTAWSLATVVTVATAQGPTHVDAAPPLLQRLVAWSSRLEASAAAPTARDVALRILLQLRAGGAEGGWRALATATANDERDATWLVVAWLWQARATGTCRLPEERRATLLAALAPAKSAPREAHFAGESLRVHALFAAGALLDRDGRGARTGAEWTAAAVRRQVALEASHWQPMRGAFRPFVHDGDDDAPNRADTTTLVPAALGMLLATGDCMARHLAQAFFDTAPAAGSAPDGWCAALRLVAATQRLDDRGRQTAWRELAAADPQALPAEHAPLIADAAWFALTGVRLATGAGLDESWQRFAPWLPADCERLVVRDLLAGGARYDLVLTVRDGPPRDDERDDTAHVQDGGPRLHAHLRLRATADGAPRTVVFAGDGMQTLQVLHPGETFACSLPRAQAQPHDDPQAVGRGRRAVVLPGVDATSGGR
jgi:hypothetical protein